MVERNLTWFGAQQFCALARGRLAEVMDAHVQSSIENICQGKNISLMIVLEGISVGM